MPYANPEDLPPPRLLMLLLLFFFCVLFLGMPR